MAITKCPSCGEWHWSVQPDDLSEHKCKPAWLVRVEDYDGEDEWREVRADNAEDAAKEAVKSMDEGYSRDGEKWTVNVREGIAGDEAPERYLVEIEYIPEYYPRPMLTCVECGREFPGVTYFARDHQYQEKRCSECRRRAGLARLAARAQGKETP